MLVTIEFMIVISFSMLLNYLMHCDTLKIIQCFMVSIRTIFLVISDITDVIENHDSTRNSCFYVMQCFCHK